MNEIIQPPYAGQPMRASWAAAVSDGLNRLGVMGPSRMLVREFAGGCGFEPLPANNRWHTASGPMPPFFVRYVEKTESDPTIDYDGWEIYLPIGCVSIGSTLEPMNIKAYRLNEDGDEEELPGWYRMAEPDEEKKDGAIWRVIIHAKCECALSGIDEFKEWPKKYVWAEIQKTFKEIDQEYKDNDENDVGDALSVCVGQITWTETGEEKKGLSWGYFHSVKTPIYQSHTPTSFYLFSSFTVDEDDLTLSLDRLFIRGKSFSAAGVSFMSNEMDEIEKDTEQVWLKISCLTNPATAEIKTYKEITNEGKTLTVPDQVKEDKKEGEIFVLLYTLKNGHIVSNNLDSLRNIQIYQ